MHSVYKLTHENAWSCTRWPSKSKKKSKKDREEVKKKRARRSRHRQESDLDSFGSSEDVGGIYDDGDVRLLRVPPAQPQVGSVNGCAEG